MQISDVLLYIPQKIKRLFFLKKYLVWVDQLITDKSKFVQFTENPYVRSENDVKIFAYYLPQFHSIPENDAAYGKGFTEWNNVASCIPHYIGEYQPKLPYDVGFYNLLQPGIMERQVEIAKTYGIYGFCFYYYWFSGRKVLEKPLEYWLKSDIDFHYHFCWANENWSKLWDGGNREIILQQSLNKGDADLFFEDILPYIKDDRYEKIDNKPILMVYRPSLFEKEIFVNFVVRLNELAIANGFKGFYFMSNNYEHINPADWFMDAITEFPPHGIVEKTERIAAQNLFRTTTFSILSMSGYIKDKKYEYETSFPVFKACFPCWDNLPRKAWSGGSSFIMSDDEFASWLSGIIKWTKDHNEKDEQIIYINAWNEWAEGAILEPTQRYGYKYLQIVKDCIEKSRK